MSAEGSKEVVKEGPLCRRHREFFREGCKEESRSGNDVLAPSSIAKFQALASQMNLCFDPTAQLESPVATYKASKEYGFNESTSRCGEVTSIGPMAEGLLLLSGKSRVSWMPSV